MPRRADEKRVATPQTRLKAVWLFDREGIRLILFKKKLLVETLVFYSLPGILITILATILYSIIENFGLDSSFIKLYSSLTDLLTKFVFTELIALTSYIFLTYIFIGLLTTKASKSYVKTSLSFSIFSYVYFFRIILIFGLVFQLFNILNLAFLIQMLFYLMFVMIFSFSFRTITSRGGFISFIVANLVFIISVLFPSYFI